MMVLLCAGLVAAALTTLAISIKAALNYSHPGPQIELAVRNHYRGYVVFALCRLAAAVFLIALGLALPGAATWYAWAQVAEMPVGLLSTSCAALASVALLTAHQFCVCLLCEPGTLAANSPYRISRLYRLWHALTPARLRLAGGLLAGCYLLPFVIVMTRASADNPAQHYLSALPVIAAAWLLVRDVTRPPRRVRSRSAASRGGANAKNVVLIGCDTLRADRVVPDQYCRHLTPNIAKLAERATLFTNCFVPIARTAPSIATLLTGCWPHEHGIRHNYAYPDELNAAIKPLPKILSERGYDTIAISDWAGSDLAKFDFGFTHLETPEDQWNLKYLIRQGPKDIRLFLALFTHNALAKRVLPEIYYLPGRPLVGDLGDATIQNIDAAVEKGSPFLLNVFMSGSHPPFSVGYPDYMKYADDDYAGESKFVMSKLVDPMDIIRAQGEPRESFDLDQIINLYDACVDRFDQEVGRIIEHLEARSLMDNTIVVIYSDHGMEFFEHGTWGQGNSVLGDHSTRIPLLIFNPDEPVGNRRDDYVSAVDIAPTLLEMVNVEHDGSMTGSSLRNPGSLDGKASEVYCETGIWIAEPANMEPGHLRYPNLLKLLEVRNPAAGTLGIKPEFAETVIMARDRAVRRDNWLLVYVPLDDGPSYRLYDVANDPMCTTNIIAENPCVADAMRATIDRLLSRDKLKFRK